MARGNATREMSALKDKRVKEKSAQDKAQDSEKRLSFFVFIKKL